jgi:hypothetical protein
LVAPLLDDFAENPRTHALAVDHRQYVHEVNLA